MTLSYYSNSTVSNILLKKSSLQVKRLIFLFMSEAYIHSYISVSYSYIDAIIHSLNSTISNTCLSITCTCLVIEYLPNHGQSSSFFCLLSCPDSSSEMHNALMNPGDSIKICYDLA